MASSVLRLAVLLCLAAIIASPARAADCSPSNITLTSQAGVDNFQANHGPCDKVTGQLRISGEDIRDLQGLQSLETVLGSLLIEDNNLLTNLDGLSGLTIVAIDGSFNIEIQRNAALQNIDGLNSLTTTRGALIIHLNNSLSDIRGLSNLAELGPMLHIAANPALTTLDGLEALSTLSTLGLVNNTALSDISALSNLESVNSWLEISWNSMLANCQAVVLLVDPLDDYDPGPGPGSGGIPDIGDYAIIRNNHTGCNSVHEILAEVPITELNPGLNDAWFDIQTSGQGFLITVFEEIRQVFIAWFTYDTERPPVDVTALLGEPGHRWLTAQGAYQGTVATLDIHLTAGGIFDSSLPQPETIPYGSMTIEFSTCNAGTIRYEIPSINRQGEVPIERIALDNVPLCYLLSVAHER
jgi:hypothetical protein